jgi:hypothetical protein
MSGKNTDMHFGQVSQTATDIAGNVLAIELSALRRAAKIVEKIQVLNTPWPASMHLGTALDALKAAERIIEHRIT